MTIQPHRRSSRSKKSTMPKPLLPTSQPSTSSTDMFNTTTTRSTTTHIFFWGGILSNWSCSTKFSGARCLDLLLPELEKAGIAHPPLNAFSTRLLAGHMFNCGEQWMMAMKVWLFEQNLPSSAEWIVDESSEAEVEFEKVRAAMYESKLAREWSADSKERRMWEATVCRVLRTKKPRQQKDLGRKALGFDVEVWSRVNMACVTAACVARAEADQGLREMYLGCGDRRFVEGSPTDAIWGVGLHWQAAEIEDPTLWKGENRLGLCHDQAALKIRQRYV